MNMLNIEKEIKLKCNSSQLSASLFSHYHNVKYKIENVYVYDWESDFLVIKHVTGYAYEIEIKISRQDYFNDFNKKHKHEVLLHGFYSKEKYNHDRGADNNEWIKIFDGIEKVNRQRPNRFYYCVPEGLITSSELPSYAGLLYYNLKSITKIKEAPLLHKQTFTLYKELADKFYSRYLTSRQALIYKGIDPTQFHDQTEEE